MSDLDNRFVQATDDLIALYRDVERQTIDLPLLSVTPTLIFFWAVLRFYFFFLIGIFLIIPTNLVILIRNLFPGHWRYRPFFFRHLYYVWLWIWRGEAPTAPFLFIRPLSNVFMKWHFESRLRCVRLEVVLNDGLSEATRSTLLTRLDAALERWKSPRFAAFFWTVLLPGIIAFPPWYKQLTEFMGSFGISMPTGGAVGFVSENMSVGGMIMLGMTTLGYLLAVPVTAFLAKRGLFVGAGRGRICFPGGQEGSGAYLKEREILGSVGLRAREAPIDLWILGVAWAVNLTFFLLVWDQYIAWMRSHSGVEESQFLFQILVLRIELIVFSVLFVGLFFVAALRRSRTGRL
jgi:hypothetical protein